MDSLRLNFKFPRPAQTLLFRREHVSGSNVLRSRCERWVPLFMPICALDMTDVTDNR